MNKAELIQATAQKSGLSRKEAEAVVAAAVQSITEALAQGDHVQIVGFGAFEVRERAAHIGRNPKTREEIQVAASKAPVFKAGKALKDAVAKG
ncbi:MAG: HU family DNA-binding protein [Oscillospiraceae bacterium]|nr:HU family DNA-binding protein [Oscillospiraceae bacterium]